MSGNLLGTYAKQMETERGYTRNNLLGDGLLVGDGMQWTNACAEIPLSSIRSAGTPIAKATTFTASSLVG